MKRGTLWPEELAFTLAEAKAILAKIQQFMTERQAARITKEVA